MEQNDCKSSMKCSRGDKQAETYLRGAVKESLCEQMTFKLRPGREDAAAAQLLQSCPTLCDPIVGLPPGSSVPGILQARILEWVAISIFKSESEVAQSSPTLSDSMDCSLPGSSIHRIFQARVLEWGAIAFSLGQTTNCYKLLNIFEIIYSSVNYHYSSVNYPTKDT